ncbi:MAG: IS1634 family transposase [Desulfomonilia bacterium]
MAYRVYQTNKKTGVTYVYEAVSYWDKEKHQPRNRQVCIGKLDAETGEFVPSRRLNPDRMMVKDPAVTATASIVGPSLLLESITYELALDTILKKAFPKIHEQILTMAYYLAVRGGPLSHLESWSKSHEHPFGKALTSQRISDLLKILGGEEGRATFFKAWGQRHAESDYRCYDITSVSSYGRLNEYIKYGHNRDREHLKQINLAMLSGQESELPLYYQRMPGNISDVVMLQGILQTFCCLEQPRLHLVLDRVFYSRDNVDELTEKRIKFILAVPNRLKWVQRLIDESRQTMQDPEGYHKIDGEILCAHTRLYPWGKGRRRCYAHIYYNAHAAAQAADSFTEELLDSKEELESGNLAAGHEDACQTFFTVKETPARGRRVSFNPETIQQNRNRYAGFHVLLTNDIKDPQEALQIYRNKDTVEKCFDDLKNQLDMERLRVHCSSHMDGRLFIQFIALIYMSALRKKMRQAKLIDRYTVQELLLEMETLTRVRYSGKYGQILTKITKPQQLIMNHLNIQPPA